MKCEFCPKATLDENGVIICPTDGLPKRPCDDCEIVLAVEEARDGA